MMGEKQMMGNSQQPMSTAMMGDSKPMMEQPAPVQPMMPMPGNRNVKNLPLDSNGKRGWSFGLCSCCGDCGACCCACWCPCLLNSRNRRRLDHLNTEGYPDPRRNETITGDSCLYAFVQIACDMGWILQVGTRQNTRERYGIKGSGCGDVCAAACCTMCDLVQVSREITLEEESFQQTSMM